jgi:preprotein translocase subunit SecG
MNTGLLIVIIVVVVIIALLAVVIARRRRSEGLQTRFGSEYPPGPRQSAGMSGS